ncbi:MAG: DUF1822 family protein [Spirulina sp. SIO3F2]|nr:DUF1822 family protein [Spirulina sp. SIO3F2]
MQPSHNPPALQLKVSRQAQQFAHQFSRAYETQAKRQQVYLNTLAIAVVNKYLELFDIITDLNQSPGWQVECQALDDTADLHIPGFGSLACRPVLMNAESCYLPPGDHIGCVAVQFDFDQEQLDQQLMDNAPLARGIIRATLVGFMEVATYEETIIPLTQFQDFTGLFTKLSEFQVLPAALLNTPVPFDVNNEKTYQACVGQTEAFDQLLHDFPQIMKAGVNVLGDWLEGTIESSWQTVEALLNQPAWEPAIAGRSSFAVRSAQTSPRLASNTLERCKVLMLKENEPLALIVVIEPKPTEDMRVTVELWPIREPQLPDTLEFQLLNESGIAIMQAQAHGSNHLLFTFSCDPGNIFDLKVILDQTQIIESFVI